MTFEELLEKVKTAKNLRRVIINSGATYIGESFASDELLFCWIFQHPAKLFEQKERGIVACVTKADDTSCIEYVSLRPEQLCQFREALAMNADFYYEEDEEQP